MKIRFFLKCVLGVLVFFLVVILIESQTHFAQRLFDDIVMDNKNHYLSCDKLPKVAEVMSVVKKHKEIIKKIEQVDSGQVVVAMDDYTCSGTADILITYPSHNDRMKIEQIINSDTFFGIPYRLLNV